MTGGNLRGYRQRRWTPEELAILRARFFEGVPTGDIARELDIPVRKVSDQIERRGLAAELEAASPGAMRTRLALVGRRVGEQRKRPPLSPYQTAELRRLIVAGELLKVAARAIGCPPLQAKQVVEEMGLTPRCRARTAWSDQELATLKAMYLDGQPIPAIAAVLKEKPKVVSRKVHALGLPALLPPAKRAQRDAYRIACAVRSRIGIPGRVTIWTQDVEAQLRRLLIQDRVSYAAAGEALGCSKTACQRAAKRLGLDRERDQLVEREKREAIRIQAAALAERDAARRAEEAASAARTAGDADLIAAAIAAGKVTIVPAAWACGVTAWEQATGYTARPQRTAIPTIASRRRAA